MKVISPSEMMRIEALSIAAGASQEQYMEQAGLGIARCPHMRQCAQEPFIHPSLYS